MPDNVTRGWHGFTSDISTLTAIYDYIRAQRSQIPKFPKLLPVIQRFESWAQGLSIVGASDVDEGRRFKDEVNAILGERLPETSVPADRPQTPPPASSSTATIVAVVIGALLVLGAGLFLGSRPR